MAADSREAGRAAAAEGVLAGLGPRLLPTPLLTVGHSVCAGTWLTTPATDRITGKLAKALGTTENNHGVSASGFMTDNAAAYGLLTAGGNWLTLGNSQAVPKRTRAPYLSGLHCIEIMTGINDVAQFGSAVGAGFKAAWFQTIQAAAAFARLGHWLQANDASITQSGWTTTTTATIAYGSGAFLGTATNNSTVTFTVPADYDGQAIDYFFLGVQSNATPYSATYTIRQGATVLGTGSNQAQMSGISNANYLMVLPSVVRIPTPSPAAIRGAVLIMTVTAIAGNAYLNGIGFESSPAPLVILADTLRSPLGYSGLFTGFPYIPTDADVTAVNAQNALVAAAFTDGRVIVDAADSIINKTGGWQDFVHPDERNAGRIAALQSSAVAANLTAADIAVLGI